MSTVPEDPQVMFTRWLAELRADLVGSVGGVMLRGARVVQVGSAAGATTRATTAAGSLVGFALRNTDQANPATVFLRDGWDTTGDLVVPVQLAAGESVRDWFGPGGLNLTNGLMVDVAAGAVEGSVWLRGTE